MEYVELRARAEAATPGPWWHFDDDAGEDGYVSFVACGSKGDRDPYIISRSSYGIASRNEADADFIAAANPKMILALLDALDRGRAFADNMEAIGQRLAAKHGTADAEAAKVLSDQLRAELKIQ